MLLHKPKTGFEYAIILMLIKVAFSQSAFIPYSETADMILSLLSAILFAFCIFRAQYSIRTFICYAVICLLVLYSVVKTGNYGFLISVIAILAMLNQDFDRTVLLIYEYEMLFIVVHTLIALLLYSVGTIDIFVFEKGMNRATFGFGNPNTFSVYVFNLILMWIWLNFDRMKRVHLFILLTLSLIVVSFTKTRTMMMDVMVLIVLCSLSTKLNFKRMAELCIPLATCFTWIMVFLYGKGDPIAYFADSFLNGRVRLGAYAFEHFGISLLGQNLLGFKIVWDPTWQLNHFTFDNIYTSLVVNQGMIWLVLIAIIFFKLSQINEVRINIFIIVWTLYGITEVHGLNGFMCMPIFLSVFVIRKYVSNRDEIW